MSDDAIEIMCRAMGHTVRVYATYSETTQDWTLLSFIAGSADVHAAATATDLWGKLAEMLPAALMDAEDAA